MANLSVRKLDKAAATPNVIDTAFAQVNAEGLIARKTSSIYFACFFIICEASQKAGP
jgi:hypothetical protein